MRLTDNDEHTSHYFMAANVDLNFFFFFMPYAMDIMKLAILLLFMYKPVIQYLFIF